MSENDLHLPNLTVRGFRGIQDLSIEHLGRVTLIAGRNGVGKTTLLDALSTYAHGGSYSVLSSILREREELTGAGEEGGQELLALDWDALFHGRCALPNNPIAVGSLDASSHLKIEVSPLRDEEADDWDTFSLENLPDEEARMLRVTFQGKERPWPLFRSRGLIRQRAVVRRPEFGSFIRCISLGPSVLESTDVARFWDKVALTDDENRAVEALRLVYGGTILRAAVVGDDKSTRSRYGRRAIVKIAGHDGPVPLRSLGDGAVRLFGVALALANSHGGFLLIDEAENGIHHTIQRDFWRMVLLTAEAYNVQVFATTHSWDCVVGFAQAAVEEEGVEGALVRLDSDGEGIRAVEYSERQLRVAAEQGIEVR